MVTPEENDTTEFVLRGSPSNLIQLVIQVGGLDDNGEDGGARGGLPPTHTAVVDELVDSSCSIESREQCMMVEMCMSSRSSILELVAICGLNKIKISLIS